MKFFRELPLPNKFFELFIIKKAYQIGKPFLFAINQVYFLLFTSLMYFSKAIVIEGVSGVGA